MTTHLYDYLFYLSMHFVMKGKQAVILAFTAKTNKIIYEHHEPALEPHKEYNEIDKITTKATIDVKMKCHRKDEQTNQICIMKL